MRALEPARAQSLVFLLQLGDGKGSIGRGEKVDVVVVVVDARAALPAVLLSRGTFAAIGPGYPGPAISSIHELFLASVCVPHVAVGSHGGVARDCVGVEARAFSPIHA